ncbi:MAG: hypothetical protein SPG84_00095, partial [Vescimonas sp.]|uniref:hypothetical protein n=1 Tax=Vescimonas sp. TaxID=2892404 RepID=UPI002A9158F3
MKQKRQPKGWRFSLSINPRPCHSEPVTDVTGVGIRNLLAGNLRKSAGIMHFGNGLPRQSADWLAMTGFFDRLRNASRKAGVSLSKNYQNPRICDIIITDGGLLHGTVEKRCKARAGDNRYGSAGTER